MPQQHIAVTGTETGPAEAGADVDADGSEATEAAESAAGSGTSSGDADAPDCAGSGADADAERPDPSDQADSVPPAGGRRLRMPTSGRGRFLAAALVLVLLAGAGGVAWWRITALPSDAAYRYDGHVVTVDQLDQRIDVLRALYGVEQPQDPGKADAFRRDVAKSDAVSGILDEAAADRRIVVADKQVEDTLDRYVEQQFGPGGRDAFVKALGNVGTSESAVRDEVRRQLTVSRLMEQVVGTITISDADLKAAYDQRKGTLGTPEKRTLRNIVVTGQQDAQSVLDQLTAGTPIEQVAATRSLDASTKDAGGSLGEVARADLEQPVGDAAFGVGSAGQFYGPVQGAHGWNVGRVDAITPFVPATYEQVAGGLAQALQVERSLAVWRDWLGQQIQEAGVEYADAYRPADPDAVPSIGSVGAPTGGEPPR